MTQGIEQDVVKALEEMVQALERAHAINSKSKPVDRRDRKRVARKGRPAAINRNGRW